MKTAVSLTASLFLLFVVATPVQATGGFSCSIDDENLSFETSSALGAGMGGPIINLAAALTLKMKGTPTDLSKLDLSKNLVHSWMADPDLRLLFYTEREGNKPHGSVEITIMAQSFGEEGEAKGGYQLTVFYTEPPADKSEGVYLKATGKVECFVE